MNIHQKRRTAEAFHSRPESRGRRQSTGKDKGAGDKRGQIEDNHGAERVGQAEHGVLHAGHAEPIVVQRNQNEDDGGKQSDEEERDEQERVPEVGDAAKIGLRSGSG